MEKPQALVKVARYKGREETMGRGATVTSQGGHELSAFCQPARRLTTFLATRQSARIKLSKRNSNEICCMSE